MQEVVIVEAVRTPIARIRGGLATVRPDDLLAAVISAAVERSTLKLDDIQEVFAGCANQAGEDNRNVARMATLLAGLPQSVPAITVNRLCASGLDAVIAATRAIQVGDRQIVVAGGVESMTRAPYAMAKPPVGFGTGNPAIFDTTLGWRFPNPKMEALFPLEGMGQTAENLVQEYEISREAQDTFAYQSHQKAIAAWEAGRFSDEVIPVEIKLRKSSHFFDKDEGPRADSSPQKLATLRPAFKQGGSVTAGNSSTLNDGASALVLMEREIAEKRGLKIMGRIVACASAGVNPRIMGIGPVPATQAALDRAGWKISDLDLVELNEAFAAQSLAVLGELGISQDIVNVNGGAIALGHPLGCSGARILTTLMHEMGRRDARRGLASLCVGVGQGVSVLVEKLG
jgi:acetyl-CoA acyltransferase